MAAVALTTTSLSGASSSGAVSAQTPTARFSAFKKASNLPSVLNKKLLQHTAEYAGYSYMGQKIQNQLREVETHRLSLLKLLNEPGKIDAPALQKEADALLDASSLILRCSQFAGLKQDLNQPIAEDAKHVLTDMKNLLEKFTKRGRLLNTANTKFFLAPLIKHLGERQDDSTRTLLIKLFKKIVETDKIKLEKAVKDQKNLNMHAKAVARGLPFNCVDNHYCTFFGSLGEPDASGVLAINKENPLDMIIGYAGTNSGQNVKTDVLAIPKHIPFLNESNKAHAGFVYGLYASKINLEHDIAKHLDHVLQKNLFYKTQLLIDLKTILKEKNLSDLFDTSELSKLMHLVSLDNIPNAKELSNFFRRDGFFGASNTVKILEQSAIDRLKFLRRWAPKLLNEETITALEKAQGKLKKYYAQLESFFLAYKHESFDPEKTLETLLPMLQDTLSPNRSAFHIAVHTALMKQVRLTITGHSMGGALATLSGLYFGTKYDLGKNLNIITFASPRTLAPEAVTTFTKLGARNIRVENIRDIIPRLPGAGIFRHVPNRVLLSEAPVLNQAIPPSHKMSLYREAVAALTNKAIDNKLKSEQQENDTWWKDFKHRIWIHSTSAWITTKKIASRLNPFA